MPTLGPTPYLANSWLDTLCGTSFVVPVVTFQPYIGVPGDDGTSHPALVTTRTQVTLARTGDGQLTIVSAASQITALGNESWSHGAVWSGFEGDVNAKCLFTGAAKPAKTVSGGDRVNIVGITLTLTGLAAD